VGPVLNSLGEIESSPDCIVVDQREHPFRPRRCEFKWIPQGKEDFGANGVFEIAIIWALPDGLTRKRLLDDLLQQNGCSELIVLKEEKAFWDLPIYTPDSISKLGDVGVVRELILGREGADGLYVVRGSPDLPGEVQYGPHAQISQKAVSASRKNAG